MLALAAIVVAAALLFFRLGAHDPLTDEEEIAFRAVGYMDYLATPSQTTPYEWFAVAPWWVGLSFHDHPPLLFALEHVVFRLFGDSLFVLRLPFALLGIASLGLLGALARHLYDDRAALIVMALAAVNTYWLWVFRIGLQEGPVVFFLLASLYCLTRARTEPRWLLLWGVATGLGLLTKYTSILILPASLAYVLAFAPRMLRTKTFALALVCTAVVFSPVLVYNVALVRAVGHPDLQLASLLRQHTAEWGPLPRKALGTFGENVALFVPSLWQNATRPFVVLLAGSLLALLASLVRRRGPPRTADGFVLVTLAITAGLIVLIGPSQRFLALLMPFALLACASAACWLLSACAGRAPRAGVVGALAVALIAQAYVSFQTLHAATAPVVPFSALRVESAAYGYGALEAYLHELLDTARPAVTLDLPPRLRFVESFRARRLRHTGAGRQARMVIYDPRINNVARLWLYDRRYYYDGWPILPVDDYVFAKESYPGLFTDLGITDYYYIAAEDGLFTAGNTSASPHASEFRAKLASRRPERVLVGPDGRPVFTVFHSAGAF